MTRQEIIEKLAVLKEPDRSLDQRIAVLFKYRREQTVVPATESKEQRIRVAWYDPDGSKIGPPPYFTESLEDAKSLFDRAFPNAHAAVSWDKHGSYAKMANGGEVVTAFNPATALCLLTLKSVQIP